MTRLLARHPLAIAAAITTALGLLATTEPSPTTITLALLAGWALIGLLLAAVCATNRHGDHAAEETTFLDLWLEHSTAEVSRTADDERDRG